MRVRDHILLSSGGAAFLYPWLRDSVLVPWAASILIDVDHYLWFCVHERSVDLRKAVRYFNQAQPPQHAGARLLHHPAILLVLLMLSARWRWAALLLMGMTFHVGLDIYHSARLDRARAAALCRDCFTCQRCGIQGPGIVAHQWCQAWLLPSYRPDYLISLCAQCHEIAHVQARSNRRAAGSHLQALHLGTPPGDQLVRLSARVEQDATSPARTVLLAKHAMQAFLRSRR